VPRTTAWQNSEVAAHVYGIRMMFGDEAASLCGTDATEFSGVPAHAVL
jgi:hypothetical protein